jgi:PAS domain S-box-containing protein
MNAFPNSLPPPRPRTDEKAIVLALRLANAESAVRAFSSDQVDAILDADGNPYLLRAAQEDLRQKARRMEATLQGVGDGITVVNRGGRILSQSSAVNRVLGYESEELVETNFFDLIPEEDLPLVHLAFLQVAESFQDSATAQFRCRARDGAYCEIEAMLGKYRGDPAESVVFSLRPIAKPLRERAEQAMREAAAAQIALAKDRFLAMLSHELRTPLMPIFLGVGELLEDERFIEARPMLAMIKRNLELQTKLVEDLTDFIKIGQHKMQLQLAPIDAHEHVGFVLEICESEIAAAQLKVVLNLDAEKNWVQANSVRLQQVMWNLLKNAIKFSPPGSIIAINSSNDALGHLALEFVDAGIGIASDLLPLLFDPFQQGDLKHYGGLGLGLFIAKGLAEAQGGTLAVSSEGPGKGATFRLTLDTALSSPNR